jgi:hypothetical protein
LNIKRQSFEINGILLQIKQEILQTVFKNAALLITAFFHTMKSFVTGLGLLTGGFLKS